MKFIFTKGKLILYQVMYNKNNCSFAIYIDYLIKCILKIISL